MKGIFQGRLSTFRVLAWTRKRDARHGADAALAGALSACVKACLIVVDRIAGGLAPQSLPFQIYGDLGSGREREGLNNAPDL